MHIEASTSQDAAPEVESQEVHACVNVLPCAAAEPWVEGYVQGLSEQAEGFRLAAARGAERAAQAEEALVDAERRRSDAELRLAALEEAAALWEARALDAEAAVAAERRRAGDEAAACEAQRQRERHLAAEALERERRHSGRLSDAVACLEEQLADRSKVIAELMAQAEELSDRARALEVKAQEQRAMSEELQLQLSRKEQALATDGMSFASIVRSASAKEVAAQKLLADAERRSQELARREGDVQRTAECFESERLHLVEECRQEVERQKSELRARLQLREDRVNSHLADCNRRAEVELERRLSLLASREASAAEALRQKQQIQDQAKTIEDLQHQLERQKERLWRATSEPQIRYSTRKAGDLKTREAPWYKGTVKKVINNLPKYNAMSTEEKPKKNKAANKPQSMEISEPKAPKLTKSQKREKRKQALSLGKVGKTSPTAMPAASPTLKAVSPKATPEEDTQMKVDVEKSKKRRRKEQRRAIQVHKTQLKKKGQTAHLKS
ncbi:kif2 [Symbiodinium microadriaticum]|nr:kif2 [Symbiodinium microadriaticum]